MTETNGPNKPRSPQGQTVYWVIATLLVAIATALWVRPSGSVLPSALAQTPPLAGARGIFAFTGPLDRDQYGLFMLDVDEGTVWCYAFDTVGGTRKLRLVAARTWVYDRYLQDFNCAPPDFRMVQKLVSEQRTRPAAEPASQTPAGEESTRSPGSDRPPKP